MQEAAKHTIKVLKKLLQQKNGTVRRYEQKLRRNRVEREAERSRLETEVARLQGLLDDRNVAGAAEDIREASDQVRRARGMDRRAKEAADKLQRALRDRVQEVEDLLEVNQKELYSAQDALADTRRRLKSAEIKNGERLAENEIMRAQAVELQHMSVQYPKMKDRLKKLTDKLQRAKKRERRLRAMVRDSEMAELEGSDFDDTVGATKKKRSRKKPKKSKDKGADSEEKQEDEVKADEDSNDGSSSDGSRSSSSDDDKLLNDPVDGDSALAVMIRKMRRRFNKKQEELKSLKKQFEEVRNELVEVSGDLEEARIAAKNTKERALNDVKEKFDQEIEALVESHRKEVERLGNQTDMLRKELSDERTALATLGGRRVSAAEARTVGQLQQRNAVLKHQLDRTKNKLVEQTGRVQKLQEDAYILNERLKNAHGLSGNSNQSNIEPTNASKAEGLAKDVQVLSAQNKVLRQALADIKRDHEKKLRIEKQKAAAAARRSIDQSALQANSQANKQARQALLDAQKRIKTLSQRIKDKDEVCCVV